VCMRACVCVCVCVCVIVSVCVCVCVQHTHRHTHRHTHTHTHIGEAMVPIPQTGEVMVYIVMLQKHFWMRTGICET